MPLLYNTTGKDINSIAVPVLRWLGERIDAVEAACAPAARGGR